MANLPEVAQWTEAEDNIYQLELNDFITGGPGGNDNEPHRILGNRTLYLKKNKADKYGNTSIKFRVANATADTEAVPKKQMISIITDAIKTVTGFVKKTGDTMTGNLRVPALLYGTPTNGMEGELAGNYWKLYNSKGKGSTKNEFSILGNISDSTDSTDDKVFSMFMAGVDSAIIGQQLTNKNGVWHIGGEKIADVNMLPNVTPRVYTYQTENGYDSWILAENILGDTNVTLEEMWARVFIVGKQAHLSLYFLVKGFGTKTLPTDNTWNFSLDLSKLFPALDASVTDVGWWDKGTCSFSFSQDNGSGNDGAWNGNKDTSWENGKWSLSPSTKTVSFSSGETEGYHQGIAPIEVNKLWIMANIPMILK